MPALSVFDAAVAFLVIYFLKWLFLTPDPAQQQWQAGGVAGGLPPNSPLGRPGGANASPSKAVPAGPPASPAATLAAVRLGLPSTLPRPSVTVDVAGIILQRGSGAATVAADAMAMVQLLNQVADVHLLAAVGDATQEAPIRKALEDAAILENKAASSTIASTSTSNAPSPASPAPSSADEAAAAAASSAAAAAATTAAATSSTPQSPASPVPATDGGASSPPTPLTPPSPSGSSGGGGGVMTTMATTTTPTKARPLCEDVAKHGWVGDGGAAAGGAGGGGGGLLVGRIQDTPSSLHRRPSAAPSHKLLCYTTTVGKLAMLRQLKPALHIDADKSFILTHAPFARRQLHVNESGGRAPLQQQASPQAAADSNKKLKGWMTAGREWLLDLEAP